MIFIFKLTLKHIKKVNGNQLINKLINYNVFSYQEISISDNIISFIFPIAVHIILRLNKVFNYTLFTNMFSFGVVIRNHM